MTFPRPAASVAARAGGPPSPRFASAESPLPTDTSLMIFVALAALAAVVLAAVLSAAAFRRRIARLWRRVGQGASGIDQSPLLPGPVLDFARRSGAGVEAGHLALVLVQQADLRLRRGGLFTRFEAHQIVALGEPGFAWHARRGWGPLTSLRVYDAFVAGEGCLEARLFGVFVVARARSVETTLAEAYRYLAELPFAPDAILGNPALQWRMVSDTEAEVKLNTRVGTARVVFRFDAAGDIVGMEARDRPAEDEAHRPVRLDWRGVYGEYRQIGARRLPAYAEVGYVRSDGYEPYFRGRLTDCRPL